MVKKMGINKLFSYFIAGLIFLTIESAADNTIAAENIRPPAVAGSFYPESPSELREMITKFLNNVPDEKPAGEILAAMAPHAGYVYSGAIAARTFKQLSRVDFDTIKAKAAVVPFFGKAITSGVNHFCRNNCSVSCLKINSGFP